MRDLPPIKKGDSFWKDGDGQRHKAYRELKKKFGEVDEQSFESAISTYYNLLYQQQNILNKLAKTPALHVANVYIDNAMMINGGIEELFDEILYALPFEVDKKNDYIDIVTGLFSVAQSIKKPAFDNLNTRKSNFDINIDQLRTFVDEQYDVVPADDFTDLLSQMFNDYSHGQFDEFLEAYDREEA
jgi:hypothetical protein